MGLIFIDREAGEIICLVASVHQSALKDQTQDVIYLLERSGRYWYLALPSTAKSPMEHTLGTLLKNHRVFISKGVKNGCAFKVVVHLAVDLLLINLH